MGSEESSRPRTRFGPRLWRLFVAALSGWGTLVLGHGGVLHAEEDTVAAGGLLVPPGGIVAEREEVRALVLDQVKRAPAGTGRKRATVETRQLLIVSLDGQKLYMAEYDRDERGSEFLKQHVQVRLDGDTPHVYTISPDGTHYREHAGDLNELQRDRDIAEVNELQLAARLPPRQRQEYFRRNCHLRPDGRREVTVTRTEGERIREQRCEHVVVEENCLTIVDAQVATGVPGARNYYHLYRRLGAFSEDVLEHLAEIDGVPLVAKITVVTALKRWPLEVETKAMDVRDVATAFFELPPNAVEIVEATGPATCPICSREFERDNGVPRTLNNNRTVLLCTERCAEEFQVRRVKAQEEAAKGR